MESIQMPVTTIDLPRGRGGNGPLTRARLHRAAAGYWSLFAIGVLGVILLHSPAWRSAAAGLWFPGAGFLVGGGWAVLLLPATLIIFAASLVAWFGAGATTAPPLVWAASAAGAGLLAQDSIWAPGPWVAAAALLLFVLVMTFRRRRAEAARTARKAEREAYLPAAVAHLRSITVPRMPAEASETELTPKQLAALRYSLDRALQPVGDLSGFDKKDQFQTSALRYQLNQLGYTLALAQSRYTPSFHGYLSHAQRNILEQYVQRPIWHYWRYENAWGNLRWNADPATRDNIMLTGYVGINLALYTLNTRDMRYAQPGSMPFQLNERVTYEHSMETIIASLLDNFRSQAFCLYPCEPNWIYSGCNFRGLTTIAAYDAAMGTNYFDEISDTFRGRLESEFINTDDGVVALRSGLTGLAVPFPVSDANLPLPLNVLFPDLAERYWAYTRHDLVSDVGGAISLKMASKAVDFGNYKPGFGFLVEPLHSASRELGDYQVSEAAEIALDELCDPVYENGVLTYRGASNLSNASIGMSLLLRRDYWRDTIRRGPADSVFTGPLLEEMDYPAVLVARTDTDGQDLRLVLYPGTEPGPRTIAIGRLAPGLTYSVTGATDAEIVADSAGRATLRVILDGRTPVHITPALA